MSRAAKRIEHCLWAVGFLALGFYVGVLTHSAIQQSEGNRELNRRIEHPSRHKVAPPHGSVVARVEIPRLDLSAVVLEGTDAGVLRDGVGHLTGSSLPGEYGNVVFAGHRDSFFRALKDIRKGDVVRVTSERGTRRYSVDSTEIVSPSETQALRSTSESTLTLVTCYPFSFIGHAPQRFIVRCRTIASPPRYSTNSTPAGGSLSSSLANQTYNAGNR
jgi:sortase A